MTLYNKNFINYKRRIKTNYLFIYLWVLLTSAFRTMVRTLVKEAINCITLTRNSEKRQS